ncbi:MAG TPA: prepilin-type N-terminal cleavage/methylation domain-containing protein [Polyangiaceae bacterium]
MRSGRPSIRELARAHARARGMTLIEIMVVLVILVVVAGVAVAGSMQLPSARLRRSATMIASAVKVGYTRATATSRDLRLVMDIDGSRIWLEESDAPMLAKSKDTNPTGGADPVTQLEQTVQAEGATIMKGPPVPKPRFHPIEAYGFGDVDTGKGGKPLQRGIKFRSVQTPHDDAARTKGRAYLYFWPGGRTENASIQVRIGDSGEESEILTLLVSPLTGKVTIKSGPAELVVPMDDTQASDRKETF